MALAAPVVAIGRTLKLTLVSAENLEDVRILGRMKVYAKVSMDELPATVIRSKPDRDGETNPRWGFDVKYQISKDVLESDTKVVVELKCERSLGDNRYVGRVRIGLRELFEMGMSSEKVVSYPVEDCPHGRLHVRYSFSKPCSFVVPNQHAVEPETGLARMIFETIIVVLIEGVLFVLGEIL